MYVNNPKLSDSSGHQITSVASTDGYYLGTAIIQNVRIDPRNSSTTNLDAGNSYTFTGTAVSTLGVVALQVSLKTDKNATVYVDQSPDGYYWDISDSFTYYYSKGGDSWSVQAVNSYARVRVVLFDSSASTYFRLQFALCPVVDTVARSLSSDGRLKTETTIKDPQTNRTARVTPLEELKTVELVRLVGTGFDGYTKDGNFWTETVTGSGAVTQSGQISLTTGATANSTVKYTSSRKGRKVPGTSMEFRAGVRFVTAGTADNKRLVGAYSTDEGLFFQLSGTTFSVVARTNGSDANIVSSGSFNGNLGSTYTMNTNYHRLVIIYSESSAEFYIDGVLLHTLSVATAPLTNTLTLPVTIENINFNGSVTPVTFNCRFASILRLGKYTSANRIKYISTTGTYNLKYNGGHLKGIIVTDNTGTVTVYDYPTATAGFEICFIDCTKVTGNFDFGADFNNALTVVTTGNARTTIVYE